MASGMAKSLVFFQGSRLFSFAINAPTSSVTVRCSSFSSHVLKCSGKRSSSIRYYPQCCDFPWSFRERLCDAMARGIFTPARIRRGGSRVAGLGRLSASAASSKGKAASTAQDEPPKLEEEWRSRNQGKRDSKRAREWGVELATLAPAQIKQAVRCADLSEDLYDAVMIVKNLGTSSRVRNGRRRQYNYIAGLLRDVDPKVMEPVLKATKNGDVEGIMINSIVPSDESDEEEEDSWEMEDDDNPPKFIAEEWLQGLIDNIPAIEDEVYSINDIDYDRQELRKLVRTAQKSTASSSSVALEPKKSNADDSAVSTGVSTRKSLDRLRRFLFNIAQQRIENKTWN